MMAILPMSIVEAKQGLTDSFTDEVAVLAVFDRAVFRIAPWEYAVSDPQASLADLDELGVDSEGTC
jgi:hypothetical protein